MEIKINISLEDLIAALRQLPPEQREQLKAAMAENYRQQAQEDQVSDGEAEYTVVSKYPSKDQSTRKPQTREEIIAVVDEYFQRKPVAKVYLFGSVARNEHDEESDIDLLIEFEKSYKATLFDIIEIKDDLEALTGHKVDVVEKHSAYPHIQAELQKDKILISCQEK